MADPNFTIQQSNRTYLASDSAFKSWQMWPIRRFICTLLLASELLISLNWIEQYRRMRMARIPFITEQKWLFCTFQAKICYFYLIFPKNCNFEVNIREYCKLWEFYSLVLTHLLQPASLDISCNRTLHAEGYYNISSSGSTRPRCKLLVTIFYFFLKTHSERERIIENEVEFSVKEGHPVILRHLFLALSRVLQSDHQYDDQLNIILSRWEPWMENSIYFI